MFTGKLCGAPTKAGTPCKITWFECRIKAHALWHDEQATKRYLASAPPIKIDDSLNRTLSEREARTVARFRYDERSKRRKRATRRGGNRQVS